MSYPHPERSCGGVTGIWGRAGFGGDAGIGKSRLLDAFLARVRASGARTVVGHCAEAEARRPFGPFIDLLRGVRELPRPMQTESDLALADPNVRYRALRSFASAFEDLASDEPLVVAIDDLQWADEATLELFAYLARSLRGRQVLLVASTGPTSSTDCIRCATSSRRSCGRGWLTR